MHGWRDFLLHLTTITIGLLIALSLEGLVEWRHHRHLVHDAEASLHAEIKGNAANIDGVLADVHKRQAALKHDVYVLNYIAANGKYPEDKKMSVNFQIVAFQGVAWKTAQSTGAISYIPYDLAQDYSSIYMQQDIVTVAQQQAARDSVLAIGPCINEPNDSMPSREQAQRIVEKIEVVQGQLILVESFMQGLSSGYKDFLATHPN
jgi:hypothetical protein